MVKNILFIMCDQLRADFLGCNGHPSISTPNIDALAQRGLNFTRAYCQAPVCGPSRMSFYTGRYLSSHGSTYNNVPLKLEEWTLGDYLRPLGTRVGLTGKTHFSPDQSADPEMAYTGTSGNMGMKARIHGILLPIPLRDPTEKSSVAGRCAMRTFLPGLTRNTRKLHT